MILGGEEMEVRKIMDLFDKKFVYLEWDDVLKGKKVLVGDNLQLMRMEVDDGTAKLRCVKDNSNNSDLYPFEDDCETIWSLVYYDPNYECKRGYAEGKQIQARSRGSTRNEWMNMEHPGWLDDYEYRVKPEEPAVTPEMTVACISDEGILSIMPAHKWNKNKGRVLMNSTEAECKDYLVETCCKRCVHEVSICCSPRLGCQGFKEAKKQEEHMLRVYKCSDGTIHVSPHCIMVDFLFEGTEEECEQYVKRHYCSRCTHQGCDFVASTQLCKGFKEVKKRRMTNHELARWLAGGRGECLQNTIAFTVWNYLAENKDKPVSDSIKIRRWYETKWSEPLIAEQ